MNTQATKHQLQAFGNKPGIVIQHEHPNRSSRRKKTKKSTGQVHLIGGARVPPLYSQFI